eukprot:m.11818 g.11818  ORF g.11818 m.11818 type:complete len:660 (-) comp4528_c0_seq2:910-2889(-)
MALARSFPFVAGGSRLLAQPQHVSRLASPLVMRSFHTPKKDITFAMNEVFDFQKHYGTLKHQNGAMADPEFVDMVLDSVGSFAEEVLQPLSATADQEGCKHLGPHEVKTPTGFKDAYTQFVEGGWQGLSYTEEFGGQNLPQSMSLVMMEIMAAANFTWTMFPGLSKGAINTILSHGSEDLKKQYLPALIYGNYTGTMCLTEPQCGSDLAQVTTKAVPQDNGSYKISGTKIFISCGEHDMSDNIVHCVLARLPGAPEGTRGISLFLVPKFLRDKKGNLSKKVNGVNIGRIEDKMGCHGSPTCEINFEEAEGYLIGTENKGLNHMFTFINTSRLGTAIQGQVACELAFQNSLWYAKERLAMRSLTGIKNKEGPADPIIEHPDIRRMLLTMKCFSEGARSMIYECALLQDKITEAERAGDDKLRRQIDDRMGFLTPILKGFLTEIGIDAANMGIQVYGGHGYIKSNKQEQVLRDSRIAAVWEGTTGIQALDLLGRKIMLQGFRPLNTHLSGVYSYCTSLAREGGGKNLRKHALNLLLKAAEWHAMSVIIAAKAQFVSRDAIGVASVDYLMYSGYIHMGYHWLKQEAAAEAALANSSKAQSKEFYEAKIQSAQFYFDHILPKTTSLRKSMLTPIDSVMAMKPGMLSINLIFILTCLFLRTFLI